MNPVSKARGAALLALAFAMAGLTACGHAAPPPGSAAPTPSAGRPAWAPAGDFEGALSYGIGVDWPIPHANPQFPVRTVEVEQVTSQGQQLYTVAFDVNAGSHN
jgi:hypothetical protein